MQGLRRGFDETRWAVVDYSVGGDGYDQIQKAIDSLSASGGFVYIPEGIYNLTKPISFVKDDVTIEGAGNSTRIIVSNGSPGFMIGGTGSTVRQIKIRNLYLEGSNNGAHNTGWGIDIKEGRRCEVSNCHFKNWGRYGIFWETCTSTITKGNVFEDIIDQAIFYDNGADYNTCVGNVIRNCNGGVATDVESRHNTIIGNTYYGNESDISTWTARSAFGAALCCSYNSYIGNTIYSAKGHGIFLNGSYCVANGNTIYKVGLDGSGSSHGIFLQGHHHSVVGNTIVMGSGQHGIMVQAHNCIVDGNNILGSPTARGTGILVYQKNGATISNNIISDFWKAEGISVQGISGTTTMAFTSNNKVIGNQINDCLTNGIAIYACSGTIINGNLITGCSGLGIRNYGCSDYNVYTSNVLRNNIVMNFSGAEANDIIENNITT